MTNELTSEQEPATSLAGTEQPFGRWLEESGKNVAPSESEPAHFVKNNPVRPLIRLNQLTYTLAVIKEVLRMFPAVSGTRAGEPDFCVTDEAGHQFPTHGFLIWDDPQLTHRDPRYWPRSDNSIPERWLLPPDDALHPVPGAWRPFSQGPRNCMCLPCRRVKHPMMMTLSFFELLADGSAAPDADMDAPYAVKTTKAKYAPRLGVTYLRFQCNRLHRTDTETTSATPEVRLFANPRWVSLAAIGGRGKNSSRPAQSFAG